MTIRGDYRWEWARDVVTSLRGFKEQPTIDKIVEVFFFDVITSQFDETSVLPVEVLIT